MYWQHITCIRSIRLFWYFDQNTLYDLTILVRVDLYRWSILIYIAPFPQNVPFSSVAKTKAHKVRMQCKKCILDIFHNVSSSHNISWHSVDDWFIYEHQFCIWLCSTKACFLWIHNGTHFASTAGNI